MLSTLALTVLLAQTRAARPEAAPTATPAVASAKADEAAQRDDKKKEEKKGGHLSQTVFGEEKKKDEIKEVKIDLDGLEFRAIALPMPSGAFGPAAFTEATTREHWLTLLKARHIAQHQQRIICR